MPVSIRVGQRIDKRARLTDPVAGGELAQQHLTGIFSVEYHEVNETVVDFLAR